ncbi:MAG: cytochrome c [Opitutaceae bacterium]|jgi:mono/diheme cytochrome c family protein|nr:cytochrome c [Opitutaceae bacterium]
MSDDQKKSNLPPHVPAPQHERAEQAGANDQSIQKVHAILLREKEEPSEGFTPMPLFLLGIISTMILVCSIYVVHYRGDFDPLVYDHRYDAVAAKAAASGPKVLTPEQFVAAGKRQYATCVACHQASGLGVAGVYPPLAASEWVLGNEERLIRVLLHGLNGPIQVKGNTYNGLMPAFGKVPGGGYNWSNERIAQVLTYIRQEWGNTAAPITTEKVAEVLKAEAARTKPWTQDELKPFE